MAWGCLQFCCGLGFMYVLPPSPAFIWIFSDEPSIVPNAWSKAKSARHMASKEAVSPTASRHRAVNAVPSSGWRKRLLLDNDCCKLAMSHLLAWSLHPWLSKGYRRWYEVDNSSLQIINRTTLGSALYSYNTKVPKQNSEFSLKIVKNLSTLNYLLQRLPLLLLGL